MTKSILERRLADTNLLIQVISVGKARIEGTEYCFDGIRYSFRPGQDMSFLVDLIGRNRLESSLR